MLSPLLVIDVPNLAHRAFHALTRQDVQRRVVSGVLRDLGLLARLHQCSNFVFCFDQKCSRHTYVRRRTYPPYKANHTANPTVERQIQDLLRVLTDIGYQNIFSYDATEADDIMGWICDMRESDQQLILVSSDQDLYQLLGKDISIWNPYNKTMIREDHILAKFGITTGDFVLHKAITGCTSDNIAGIEEVGAIRATQYILGQATSAIQYRIENNWSVVRRNIKLIQLPYHELFFPEELEIQEDFDLCWDQVVRSIGLDYLVGKEPKQ